MPDLAGNLYPEDVGSAASTQQLMVVELSGTSGVSGAELANVPTLATDNSNGDNQTQEYCTTNISTSAEPAHGVG